MAEIIERKLLSKDLGSLSREIKDSGDVRYWRYLLQSKS